MTRIALDDPRYYFNRHLQWLEFNRRVLEEVRDTENPLLERVKFLAITANNLDEFAEVRVSSFLQRIEHGSSETSPDGLTAEEELEKVSAAMHIFVRDQYKCWNEELLPALAKQSIRVLTMSELDAGAGRTAKTFYERRVSPTLTPVTVDPSHPFPRVLNKALCIAFLLRRRRGSQRKPYFGVVTVPRALPRLLRVPAADGGIHYVFLQDIISTHAAKLYRGYEILACAPFRITRNSNLYLEQEESRSLMETVDSQVLQRRKGEAVRLEVEAGAHQEIVQHLVSTFELDDSLVFRVHGPVNLQRLFQIYEETPRPELKYKTFGPRHVRVGHDADSLFATQRRQEVLLHHPYDSYDTVENFLHTAAHDPRVLSIKQTLYRTNSDSPIARTLLEAAGKKEVTVVVELKASFDEASNIRWARSFEDAGVQPLLLAPRDMARTCASLIAREGRHARRGNPARIIVKVNAIVDPSIIQALYRASRDGVEIDLIVRGQCTLVPGLRGISSRIRVRSIVGRFLEHSRVFYFENGGKPEIYLGSADWMPRNLYERVEVLFPLKDAQHRQRICKEILGAYLADRRKARLLEADGRYVRARAARGKSSFSAQEHLMRLAEGHGSAGDIPAPEQSEVAYNSGHVRTAREHTSDESSTQESVNATV